MNHGGPKSNRVPALLEVVSLLISIGKLLGTVVHLISSRMISTTHSGLNYVSRFLSSCHTSIKCHTRPASSLIPIIFMTSFITMNLSSLTSMRTGKYGFKMSSYHRIIRSQSRLVRLWNTIVDVNADHWHWFLWQKKASEPGQQNQTPL